MAIAATLVLAMTAAQPAPLALSSELEQALTHLRELAHRYEDLALRFTCDETIYYHSNYGREEYRFRYLYRRRDDGSLDDDRQPRSRRGTASLADAALPAALQRAYSWVFLFDDAHARHYTYFRVGEETIDRRTAVGVRAVPKEPIVRDLNEWVATAWVAKDTGELLRVDGIHVADEEVRAAYSRSVLAGDKSAWSYTFEEIVTEFGVVGGGLRLPSEVRFVGLTYFQDKDTPRRDFLVRQLYRNYRFFRVETRTAGTRDTAEEHELREAPFEPPILELPADALPTVTVAAETAARDARAAPDSERVTPPPSRAGTIPTPHPPPLPQEEVVIVRPQAPEILFGPEEILWEGSPEGSTDTEFRVFLEPYPLPICSVTKPPFACRFDASSELHARTLRVEKWQGDVRVGVGSVTTTAFPEPVSVSRYTLRTHAVLGAPDDASPATDLDCTFGGRPCRIVSADRLAERPRFPVSLEILVDTSSSVRAGRKELIDAVERLLDEAPGEVAISLAQFDRYYSRLNEFTTNRAEARRAVDRLSGASGDRTCLFESMRRSLAHLATRPGHRLLFVLSDGFQSCSREPGLRTFSEDAGSLAHFSREAGVQIYTYTLREPTVAGRSGGSARQVAQLVRSGLERNSRLFEGLAAETGGAAVRRSQFTSVKEAFDRLTGDLHGLWLLDLDVDPTVADGVHSLRLVDPATGTRVRHPLYVMAGGHEESLIAMLRSRWSTCDASPRGGSRATPASPSSKRSGKRSHGSLSPMCARPCSNSGFKASRACSFTVRPAKGDERYNS